MFQMMNPLSGIEMTGINLQIMIMNERNMSMFCVLELMYVLHIKLFSQLFVVLLSGPTINPQWEQNQTFSVVCFLSASQRFAPL